MHIHYFQHVEFETPAYILTWAEKHNYKLTSTKFFNNELPPKTYNFDLLIVMGGPMSIDDENKYPWLTKEKEYISNFIKNNGAVLGICLGAQLIADVLGATVQKNNYKEIGWYPIIKNNNLPSCLNNLPTEFTPLHWHGDTFSIPNNAIPLGSSSACKNQGFIFNKKVIGLQFHLESTLSSIKELCKNSKDEFTNEKYVQDENNILILAQKHIKASNKIMENLLDNCFCNK